MLRARTILGRLAQATVTLVLVTLALFGLLHAIPGGPFRNLIGEGVGADPAAAQRAEALLGLDRPPLERYASWLAGLVAGDFGTSWVVAPGRAVGPLLLDGLLHTLALTATALLLAVVVGGALGLVSALRPGSAVDTGLGLASLVVGGAPTFWVGMLVLIVFAVELAWLPAGGAQTIGRGDLPDRLGYLVLPVLTLASVEIAAWGRYVRAALLDELGRDHLRTARAKGLSEWAVLLRHVLPNALPPLIGLLSLEAPSLIAGATVTEAVFSYPGLGRLLLTALRAFDWPLVQGIALLLAVAVIGASLLAEVAVALVNPRLRA
ncbi:MAG: ABC transporter permease [Chloroflexi bacterium]|nr:ABC transporter permease [Chloroflexota bacterium]